MEDEYGKILAECTWSPFYKHEITLISEWISNHMPIKL